MRSGLAAVLVIAFVLTAVVANTSSWALRTVLDGATFAATVERVLDSPLLEERIAAEIAQVTVAGLERLAPSVVEDVATRVLELPPRSDDAQVEAALTDRIVDELDTPAVQGLRHDLVLSIHDVVFGALEGDPGLITVQGEDVVLDLDGLIDQIAAVTEPEVATLVHEAGFGGRGPIVIAQVAELVPIRRAVDLMETLQVILPLLAIAVALLVVVLAHRRVRALSIVGLAVTAAGIASLVIVWLSGLYVTRIPDAPVAQQITAEVYAAFLITLALQAAALVLAGLAIALAAWIIERRRRRRAIEEMVGPRTNG